MEAYAGRGPPHPVWDCPLPPHLGPCVERLQSLLMPFLLRPSDWTETLSALQVNCQDLIGDTAASTEARIKASLQKANYYTPCMMHLVNIQLLGQGKELGSGGGSPFSESADVFVIGATNRPDLLDPAILRPGRFDQLLYVGIPTDRESQLKVLKALTRRFHFAEGFDLGSVLDACPSGLTGADFYSLCSAAMASATRNHIQALEQGELAPNNQTVLVTLEDFKVALRDLVPSVSPSELERYDDIRQKMSSSARPARNEL
ncbi:26S protease regulatory subunit, putative [Ixodes scapularis]|uniref:26S protease regulatory subunit, putative n=1 Tax=Ixodes scapularis TaxID=6945 RepID=B7QL65_IXOSC|nr:26S protease regulatory subunit, putative [Ixodes scapularis]|eukprot:XP_002415920.1 26S protease regulatory subunit, putative [Ixodes scapularis]